jgi:hypothetical protein
MTNSVEIDDECNAEHADVLVCARLTQPLIMPDNAIGICDQCGEAVQHRPHVPKQPRKLCLVCALPLAGKAAAKGELHTIITPETAVELAAHFRKRDAT